MVTQQKNARKVRRLNWKENYIGWLYCAPIIIGILTFTLVPILLSLYSMFIDWSGFSSIENATIVNWQNFYDVLAPNGPYSARFYKALGNTFLMMLHIPVSLILGMLIAMAMNRKMVGAKTFRVLYYLPCITSVVAVTIVFNKLFAYGGTVSQMLATLGFKDVNMLQDSVLVKVTVNILVLWKGLGHTSLMYLAGLQSVSKDQLEAADIDGAGGFAKLKSIMLPALYPVTFYLLVTSIMGGLQIFNEPFILVGYGLSDNAMTSASFIYYYYSAQHKLGVAAVGAWALALLVFIVTAIQMSVDNRREKI